MSSAFPQMRCINLESNYEKITQDSMKSMRKYLEEENAELRWEISELEHKQTLVEEKVKRLPELKKRVIQKNVEAYVAKLKNSDTSLLREVLLELIHNIVIDNETVKTTISLQRLLGGNEPILATVIEKRDNVAQLVNHRRQKLAFASLEISL